MTERKANEELQNTWARFAEERARWAKVLGPTGKREQAKPVRVSLLARILAAIFN